MRSSQYMSVREEPFVQDVLGRVEPGGERRHRLLVGLEEQPCLGAEVLEDRPLRDTQVVRDVLHLGALVPVLREVPHGALDDALPLVRAPASAW